MASDLLSYQSYLKESFKFHHRKYLCISSPTFATRSGRSFPSNEYRQPFSCNKYGVFPHICHHMPWINVKLTSIPPWPCRTVTRARSGCHTPHRNVNGLHHRVCFRLQKGYFSFQLGWCKHKWNGSMFFINHSQSETIIVELSCSLARTASGLSSSRCTSGSPVKSSRPSTCTGGVPLPRLVVQKVVWHIWPTPTSLQHPNICIWYGIFRLGWIVVLRVGTTWCWMNP